MIEKRESRGAIITGRWKVDSNHGFGVSLFRDGCEVASGMKKEDALNIAKRMNACECVEGGDWSFKNQRGNITVYADGTRVMSNVHPDIAELAVHALNNYRSVVSALKRIHYQIYSPSTISDSEANKLLCNIMLAAFVTLEKVGETV